MKNSGNASRRQFLRSATSLVALPLLPSLGWKRFASASEVSAPPKRLVFLGFGWGVTNETWFPNKTQTGGDYELPPGLVPLFKHKSDFTVIQGLFHQYTNEAHWGSTFWLTGANRYATPGQSFSNSVSVDQVAAERFGQHTRFSSIQMASDDADASGHGPGLSLAWDAKGKPVSAFTTPVQVYHRMFSDDTLPLAARQRMLSERRSVLDSVRADAKRMSRSLAAQDTDKLDEYFQSIRDIEIRLGKEEAWLSVPRPAAPLDEPKEGLVGRDEIKLMYDLIVAAFKTDSTRVLTYRQPVGNLLKSVGITHAPHDVSHYTPGERQKASEKRDVIQSELLSGLIDQLKATRESDGSSLFDNTCLVYGSNIRTIHYLDNCPTIVAGGGAGVKLGQHLVTDANHTPLCNLWLTLLRGVGIDVPSHGDSDGVIEPLIA